MLWVAKYDKRPAEEREERASKLNRAYDPIIRQLYGENPNPHDIARNNVLVCVSARGWKKIREAAGHSYDIGYAEGGLKEAEGFIVERKAVHKLVCRLPEQALEAKLLGALGKMLVAAKDGALSVDERHKKVGSIAEQARFADLATGFYSLGEIDPYNDALNNIYAYLHLLKSKEDRMEILENTARFVGRRRKLYEKGKN